MGTRPETFRSTGAMVFGGITVAGALTLAVLAAVHPDAGAPDWVSATLVLFAVVVYVAQVRPAVVLDESELVLRNMLETVHLPWSALGEVRIRQFLTIKVGDREFNCAAVGRSRRQIRRDSRIVVEANPAEASFGRLVETKIRNRASDARTRQGIKAKSPEQAALADDVRRVRAWPEVVALGAAAVALVVTIVV
jgi:hypothetical protein